MLLAKALAPIDVHVGLRLAHQLHQDQFFFQHLLHLQPRPVLRLEHQCGIEHTQFQLAQQVLAFADFRAQGVPGDVFAQGLGPVEHQRAVQAHLAADMQHIAIAIGQRQVSRRGFFQVCSNWLAYTTNASPSAGISRAPARLRTNSVQPNWFSRFLTRAVMAVWVTCSFSAAAAQAAANFGRILESACQFDVHEAPWEEWAGQCKG